MPKHWDQLDRDEQNTTADRMTEDEKRDLLRVVTCLAADIEALAPAFGFVRPKSLSDAKALLERLGLSIKYQ